MNKATFRFDCFCGNRYKTQGGDPNDAMSFAEAARKPKKTSMPVAYVAGPYRGSSIYEVEQNIQRARSLAVELWKRGYAVICPHMNSALLDGACDDKAFLEGGLELLRRSDVVVVLDNWRESKGTCTEIELANSLKIPVVFASRKLPTPVNSNEGE